MGKISGYIGSQFVNPHGLVGFFCRRTINRQNKKMYEKIISLAGEKSFQKILDIGYENDFMIKTLDKKFSPEIFGIAGKINFSQDKSSTLPFESEFFDAIFSVNSIYFWDDTLRALKEIHRCMKDGAVFYNAVYTREWMDSRSYTERGFKKFEPVELIVLGREAGFEKILVHEIVHRKSFVVEYRK